MTSSQKFMELDPASMPVFLSNTLDQIKEVAPKKYKELHNEIIKTQKSLSKLTSKSHNKNKNNAADCYFYILKLACDTDHFKIVEYALDCIQKLIAYGYLTGLTVIDPSIYPNRNTSTMDSKNLKNTTTKTLNQSLSNEYSFENVKVKDSPDNKPSTQRIESVEPHVPRLLRDLIIETIFQCSNSLHENVQLQVIKALLTATTSSAFEVHEQSLLLAVRACYHINLSSKSLVNRRTAQATLAQMLNSVLSRMESTSSQANSQLSENNMSDYVACTKTKNTLLQSDRQLINKNVSQNTINQSNTTKTNESNNTTKTKTNAEQFAYELITELINVVIRGGSNNIGVIRGKFGWCVNCDRPANHYCLQTILPVCSLECKLANLQKRNKIDGSSSNFSSDLKILPRCTLAARAASLRNDSFLLYRAFCKLSMKSLGGSENSVAEPISLRIKILSLELLLCVLDSAGPTFRTHSRFITATKDHLVQSLLANIISPIDSIFGLSLSIFLSLLKNFPLHLKTEIGVILDNMLLRICESPNSAFSHKMLIFRNLLKICNDARALIGIFMNYDCDPDSPSIFFLFITVLERTTQGRFQYDNWISATQESALKLIALDCLVACSTSLANWYSEYKRRRSILTENESNQDKELPMTESVTNSSDFSDGINIDSDLPTLSSLPRVSLTTPRSPAKGSSSFTQQFHEQKQRQSFLANGIVKFNMSAKSGIEYLIENGVLERTPNDISQFLLTTRGLSKVNVGEYIGDHHRFNIDVLYSLIDKIDFSGMEFDAALRKFLSGFQLPGEAQKVDRMMEKFGEKYCRNNPQVFASADVAYVLGYACIMLHTDAHNPMVKNKMTKEQFIRNNRGLNDNEDLPREFLEKIYNRITKNEIKIYGEDRKNIVLPHDPKQRLYVFQKEGERLRYITKALLQSKPADDFFHFPSPEDLPVIIPMFSTIWPPSLATFSVLFEETDETNMSLIQSCLKGYQQAIHLAGLLSADTEREAFCRSLTNCTLLGKSQEMKQKNIEAIKTMLGLSYTEGDYLAESWREVLKCISELDRLNLISSGFTDQSVFFPTTDKKDIDESSDSSESSPHDYSNSQFIREQIENSLVDRVFTHSASLNADAIVYFVEHLCAVSRAELSHSTNPRVYSLQKIIEITDYNMGRIRLVWSRIWKTLSQHFELAGCHPNPSLCMYAVDSLRQLAAKFLEKDELANYQFQEQFLKPLEYIMERTTRVEVRELLVVSIKRLVLARVANVKSGWRSVLSCLTVAASDSNKQLVEQTWVFTEKIVRDYFPFLQSSNALEECARCLAAFCTNRRHLDTSLSALDHLDRLADSMSSELNDNQSNPISVGSNSLNLPSKTRFWLSLIGALGALILDKRMDIRNRASLTLYNIMQKHGQAFLNSITSESVKDLT